VALRAVASGLPARVREHNTTLVAAGVAFYAFLALVPTLVALISVYGLVADPADVRQQVQDLSSSLPAEVEDFLVYQLTQIINANRSGLSVTLVVAIVLALWSASGGTAALITGIHVAREREEPTGFVAKKGKALLLTLAAIVFLAIVMLIGVGLLYRFSAGPHPRAWLGVVTIGAVVAMVVWLVVSGLFAAYTANFASYGKTYGALASIVVVLLWLWLTCLALLIGAETDGGDEG